MFIAALFVRARTGTRPGCPSTGDGIKALWYSHPAEYSPARKRSKVLMHSATRRNLQGITVSEKSDLQRSHTEHFWNGRILEMETRFVVAAGRDCGWLERITWGILAKLEPFGILTMAVETQTDLDDTVVQDFIHTQQADETGEIWIRLWSLSTSRYWLWYCAVVL